jgi:hypothetical protein
VAVPWLQESRTAAYERFLQAFGAVEMELREAFVDRRAPAVVWEPFNAALQSMSLVASAETMAAAERVCYFIEEFTILFHGGRPSELEELRPIHSALAEAHVKFVNAARRTLDPRQEHLVQALGGPSAWYGVESVWAPGNGTAV